MTETSRGEGRPYDTITWLSEEGTIRRFLPPLTPVSLARMENYSNDSWQTYSSDGLLLSLGLSQGTPRNNQTHHRDSPGRASKNNPILEAKNKARKLSLHSLRTLRDEAIRGGAPRFSYEPPGRPTRSVRITPDTAVWPARLRSFRG